MNKMAFAAALAVSMGATAASAADLSSGSLKDTPIYASAPIWTGFYMGGHVGGLWGDSEVKAAENCRRKRPPQDYIPADTEIQAMVVTEGRGCCYNCKDNSVSASEDDVSLVGGVHLGYNWQLDNKVIGFEGDLSFAESMDYLGSLRARFGYAHNNLLLFATGGVAFGGFKGETLELASGKKFTLDDDKKIGLVVGGGAEYKLSSNWSIGAEGLYYMFNDNDGELSAKDRCRKYSFSWDRDDVLVVRGRLNYHFQDERDAPLK